MHVKYGSNLLKGKCVAGQRSRREEEGGINAPHTPTTRRKAGPTKRNRRVQCVRGVHLREGKATQWFATLKSRVEDSTTVVRGNTNAKEVTCRLQHNKVLGQCNTYSTKKGVQYCHTGAMIQMRKCKPVRHYAHAGVQGGSIQLEGQE